MAKTGKKVQINLGEILPKVEGFKLILDYLLKYIINHLLNVSKSHMDSN